MKLLLTLFMLGVTTCAQAQTKNSSLKAVPIIDNRTYELDGNAFIVYGQSRVTIPIELPENTVEWYYMFSSFSDKDVASSNRTTIGLLSKLTLALDQTGTTSTILSTLLAPSGSSNCNVYLFPDYENSKNFKNKVDQDIFTLDTWTYRVHGSVEASQQGRERITDVNEGSYYLGIQAGTSPVIVKIEVVAIVDESAGDNNGWTVQSRERVNNALLRAITSDNISPDQAVELSNCTIEAIVKNYPAEVFFDLTEAGIQTVLESYFTECYEQVEGLGQTEEEKKAVTYGNLGWQYYDNGNIEKAIEYSLKALSINKHMGWVETNMGLFSLIKGDETMAMEYYIDAILDLKKDKLSGKHYFQAAIEDIENAVKKHPGLSGYKEILEELKREYAML